MFVCVCVCMYVYIYIYILRRYPLSIIYAIHTYTNSSVSIVTTQCVNPHLQSSVEASLHMTKENVQHSTLIIYRVGFQ